MGRVVVLLVLAVVLLSCEQTAYNETPDGAVREYVSLLRGFNGDERQAKAIFELLSERAKSNLRKRSERYGAASGKKIAPWAMIVPARMAPRFVPQAYSAQMVGKYALVDVVGVSSDQQAQVPCVLEEGLWRVDLVLPQLPDVELRPGLEP